MQYRSPFSYKQCAKFGLLHFVQYQRVQLCMIRNQFDHLADCECLQTHCVCVGLLCIASIRYLAGLYGNVEIYYYYFHV